MWVKIVTLLRLLCASICISGDVNAGIDTTFECESLDLCRNHNLCVSDYYILGRSLGTFTYISNAHLTISWIDHVL